MRYAIKEWCSTLLNKFRRKKKLLTTKQNERKFINNLGLFIEDFIYQIKL